MSQLKLNHYELLNIKPSWYWMVSDQVAEYDDVLFRPIKNIDLVRQETRNWFECSRRINPTASDREVSDLVRQMLANLEAGGEDVVRLYEWGRALDSDMIQTVTGYQKNSDGVTTAITNENGARLSAVQDWLDTIAWWKPDVLAFENRDGPDLRDVLHSSWREEVLQPVQEAKARLKVESRAWVKMQNRRTEWDQYLWEQWFGAFGYEPASVALRGYRIMKHREWWREISPTLSSGQKRQLMAWHKKATRSRDSDGFLDETNFGDLDKALFIDVLPPFYTHASKVDPFG